MKNKEKRVATLEDYTRLCFNNKCSSCPIGKIAGKNNMNCKTYLAFNIQTANDIILQWVDEHPKKTRQNEFLKQYPNMNVVDGVIALCPSEFMGEEYCKLFNDCKPCRESFWLEEIK